MKAKGFTLIELIIVIVLLGILAVTALPKYVDMQDEARASALLGIVAAIQSASGINYAASQLSGVSLPGVSSVATVNKFTSLSGAATPCETLIAGNAGLLGGAAPNSVRVSSGLAATISAGAVSSCGPGDLSGGQIAYCGVQDIAKASISSLALVVCTGV